DRREVEGQAPGPPLGEERGQLAGDAAVELALQPQHLTGGPGLPAVGESPVDHSARRLYILAEPLIIPRRHADDGAALPGEGAVVGVAAGLSDVGDPVLPAEERRGVVDAELDQKRPRRQLEDAAELPLELRDRHRCEAGERADADRLGEAAAQLVNDAAEAR